MLWQMFVSKDFAASWPANWRSSDGGLKWAPFQNDLPDAPVYDLQINLTQRLLQAARLGVYSVAQAPGAMPRVDIEAPAPQKRLCISTGRSFHVALRRPERMKIPWERRHPCLRVSGDN